MGIENNILGQVQVGNYKKHGEGTFTYHAAGVVGKKIEGVGGRDLNPDKLEADISHQPQFDTDVVDHSEDVVCNDEHREVIRASEDYKYQNQYPYNLKPKDKNVERQQRAVRAEEKTRILPKKPDNIYN